ncbi:MAG: hypothetical protein JWP98_1319 [Edaphobacter sp.]|nr:hypothetical protein [Edaphobacter sp.]
MGTFHKGISPGSVSGFLRHSHRYHQFGHCERFRRADRARVTGNPEFNPAVLAKVRFTATSHPYRKLTTIAYL